MLIRLFALLLVLLAGLSLAFATDAAVPRAAAVGGAALVPLPPLPDPVLLRRVFLPSDADSRLLAEPGGTRRLTRDEFDARVRAAAEETAARAALPKLRHVRYQAVYSSGQLSGTAEWEVTPPRLRPAFLSLDSLGFALGSAKWSSGRAAVILPAPERTVGARLWVDELDGGTLAFPWSLRGSESADEDRFEIAVPLVPLCMWELRLPEDRTPSIPTAGVLLSGPFDSGPERVWRIAAGNVAKWELRVRRPQRAEDTTPVRATRSTASLLAPGTVTTTVDFRLESPRRPLREWMFSVEPPLSVSEVVGEGVRSWESEAGQLKVTFLEPTTTARLRIGLTAPLPGGSIAWMCPTVRPVSGTLSADTLDVRIHPDFRLEGWTANDYRAIDGGIPVERGYRIAFTGSLNGQETDQRRPPVLRVRPAEVELATDEVLEWSLDPGRNRVSAQIRARVVRGPISTVAVQLSAGYTLESVVAIPDDPGLTWTAGANQTWLLEPSRPLGTGQTAEFRLEVRGPPAPFAGDPAVAEALSTTVPRPKVACLAASERQGIIRIQAGGGLRAVVPKTTPIEDDGSVPFRLREPDGGLLLTAARPTVSVAEADFAPGDRPSLRLLCRAESPVHSVTIYAPGEATVRAESAGARVRKLPTVGPLGSSPLFTSNSGWNALAMSGLPNVLSGSFWRITFPAAERGEFALWVEDLPGAKGNGGLRVELPTVCGVDFAAVLAKGDGPRCESEELRRAWKTFPASVVLRETANSTLPVSRDVQYTGLELRTVASNERLLCTLSGNVLGGGRAVTIGLPSGAELQTVLVAGKRLAVVPSPTNTLRMPLPALGDSGVPVEVTYTLRVGGNVLFRKFDSPMPALPGDAQPRRSWAFAEGCRAWPDLTTCNEAQPREVESTWVLTARGFVLVAYSLAALVLGIAVALVRAGGRGLWPLATLGLILGALVWAGPLGWTLMLRPTFAVVAVGVAGVLLVRPPRPVLPRVSPSTASISALAVLLAASSFAQAPVPVSVYFVPNPNRPEEMRVYAPVSLLDKLETLAAPALPSVVLTAASYDASATTDGVQVEAVYAVLSTRPGSQSLLLPLSGVRLERATLNGREAFPEAPDANRFVVPIPAPGRHELRLKFAVATTRRGADREVRLGIPDVPNTAVSFAAGPSGRQPEVVTRRGGQKVLPTGTGPRVLAEHGSGATLAIRWRDGGTTDGGKTALSVRELGLWEIAEADATLVTAFAYRVTGGAVSRVRIDVPDSLEVVRVTVRPPDPLTPAPRIRGWTVGEPANGWRSLDVRFQEPTDGRIAVVVAGHPRRPFTTRPVLRFPRAADVPDADRDSYHAVRFVGLIADGVGVSGAVDFPSEPLQKEFDFSDFRWDAGALARTVRRAPGATGELRPNLVLPLSFTPGASEVSVTVGRKVKYEGLMRLADAEAVALEFSPPAGQKPTELRGVALAGWGMTGGRVQAWFRQPMPGAAVRWTSTADPPLPAVIPAEGVPVEIAWPRWPSAAGGEPIRVTVRAAPNFEVVPGSTVGLTAQALAPAGEFVYTLAPGSQPPAKFVLKPIQPRPAVAPKPKPVEAPAPKIDGPAITPVAADTPEVSPARPWPHGIIAWCGGYIFALWLTRLGRRFRPESILAIGGLGALAVGAATVLGGILWVVACVGLMVRTIRVIRWLTPQ